LPCFKSNQVSRHLWRSAAWWSNDPDDHHITTVTFRTEPRLLSCRMEEWMRYNKTLEREDYPCAFAPSCTSCSLEPQPSFVQERPIPTYFFRAPGPKLLVRTRPEACRGLLEYKWLKASAAGLGDPPGAHPLHAITGSTQTCHSPVQPPRQQSIEVQRRGSLLQLHPWAFCFL